MHKLKIKESAWLCPKLWLSKPRECEGKTPCLLTSPPLWGSEIRSVITYKCINLDIFPVCRRANTVRTFPMSEGKWGNAWLILEWETADGNTRCWEPKSGHTSLSKSVSLVFLQLHFCILACFVSEIKWFLCRKTLGSMVCDFETTIQRCSPHTLCFPLVTLDLFSLCQSLLIVKGRVLGKHYLGFLLNSSWAQYRVFGTLHFLFLK